MKVLVTGANGFVGRALCQLLAENTSHEIIAAVRRQTDDLITASKIVEIEAIDANTNWQAALQGVDVIVHLAGRAHVMRENADNVMAIYRTINTQGTHHLAQQAMQAGVKRFIYISSIKVNGEGQATINDASYQPDDTPNPHDAYAISKAEAESAITSLCTGSTMQYVILRPPLIYGSGVKANFLQLIKLVHSGVPLPFGCLHNQRDMIYIKNFCDVIQHCITHPQAANKIYLPSDNAPVSTPALANALALAMRQKAKLLPIPMWALKTAFLLLGKTKAFSRLSGSLMVDSSALTQDLQWHPPYTLQQGVQATVDWFINKSNT